MNYIVIDLEFNQAFEFKDGNKTTSNPACPFEILQVGAVKLDENLQVVDSFDEPVKLNIYPRIHPFVQNITGIRSEQLKDAKSFEDVYKSFVSFIGEEKSVLCVWGTADIKELFRNVFYYQLNPYVLPRQYINVQSYAAIYLHHPSGKSIGLRNAAEIFEIPLQKSFHNAYHDAFYTAKIFQKVYTKAIVPEVYHLNQLKSPALSQKKNTKRRIDIHGLLKQFEKMFERNLSADEKSMIKLAYKMGRTNQFDTESDKS